MSYATKNKRTTAIDSGIRTWCRPRLSRPGFSSYLNRLYSTFIPQYRAAISMIKLLWTSEPDPDLIGDGPDQLFFDTSVSFVVIRKCQKMAADIFGTCSPAKLAFRNPRLRLSIPETFTKDAIRPKCKNVLVKSLGQIDRPSLKRPITGNAGMQLFSNSCEILTLCRVHDDISNSLRIIIVCTRIKTNACTKSYYCKQ